MAIAPCGFEVEAPRIPAVPRYGLLNTIQPVRVTDPHAFAGPVQWRSNLCTSVESIVDLCPPDGYIKSTERCIEWCCADPFIVKGSYDCPPVGTNPAEAFEIARRRLLAWESYEVERVFWTGVSANGQIVNPSLALGNDQCGIQPINLSPAGPLAPAAALGLLEEALTGVVPGGGVIHAPYGLAAFLKNQKLLCGGCGEDDGRYYTPTGMSLVLGAGYPGSGPDNVVAPAGTTWIFGTGPVGIWRSDVFMVPEDLKEGVNRQINDVTVFAERFYAVGFSCALFAVQVTLCGCCS